MSSSAVNPQRDIELAGGFGDRQRRDDFEALGVDLEVLGEVSVVDFDPPASFHQLAGGP